MCIAQQKLTDEENDFIRLHPWLSWITIFPHADLTTFSLSIPSLQTKRKSRIRDKIIIKSIKICSYRFCKLGNTNYCLFQLQGNSCWSRLGQLNLLDPLTVLPGLIVSLPHRNVVTILSHGWCGTSYLWKISRMLCDLVTHNYHSTLIEVWMK